MLENSKLLEQKKTMFISIKTWMFLLTTEKTILSVFLTYKTYLLTKRKNV